MPEVAFMIRRIFPRRALDVYLAVDVGIAKVPLAGLSGAPVLSPS
jgi:hypothetical protein